MSFNPTSAITGGAQTGLTSPTYTFVADNASPPRAKQYAVTALGGTQTGVRISAISDPFVFVFALPAKFKALGFPNANGQYQNVPKNLFMLRTFKGVLPAANQPSQIAQMYTGLLVPAGSDSYDAVNLRAALSLHIGLLTQVSAGLGDTITSGIM